jgi:hypothetical protein
MEFAMRAMLIPLGLGFAADTLAKPPAADAGTPRVGCEQCSSSLLVMSDADCALQVDGQDVGRVADRGTRLVRIDMGEHLISAKAADVSWDTFVRVEKPGQVIVRTNFAKARADQAQRQLAQKWKGRWVGEYRYDKSFTRSATAYYESFGFNVFADGSCSVGREGGHATDFLTKNEDMGQLLDRLSDRAYYDSRRGDTYPCKLTSDGGIESVYGTVSSDGMFTFKTVWGEKDDKSASIWLQKR